MDLLEIARFINIFLGAVSLVVVGGGFLRQTQWTSIARDWHFVGVILLLIGILGGNIVGVLLDYPASPLAPLAAFGMIFLIAATFRGETKKERSNGPAATGIFHRKSTARK